MARSGGRGTSSLQSKGPSICRKFSMQDILYGFSPLNSSSTAVMFLDPITMDAMNMPPVIRRKRKAARTPMADRTPLDRAAPPIMSSALSAFGLLRVRRKTRLAQKDHQFRSTKYLWFRQPTQPPIHGQWWSMRRTQEAHWAQWCARSGRSHWHFRHHVACPGFQPRSLVSACCSSSVGGCTILGRPAVQAAHSAVAGVPGSVSAVAR
mmetsp:Transcript_1574/g.5380  ORF Transcript_1574/g.5380 Transcript_1574/m.5380 type:complete len:208 (-) Transcript_1574:300-923(-)